MIVLNASVVITGIIIYIISLITLCKFRIKGKFNISSSLIMALVIGVLVYISIAIIETIRNPQNSLLYNLGAGGWAIFVIPVFLFLTLLIVLIAETILYTFDKTINKSKAPVAKTSKGVKVTALSIISIALYLVISWISFAAINSNYYVVHGVYAPAYMVWITFIATFVIFFLISLFIYKKFITENPESRI